MIITRPGALSRRTTGHLSAASRLLARLTSVRTLDDFVYHFGDRPEWNVIEPLIVELRDRAERTLRAHDVHVGRSIVEEGLFDLIRNGSTDPISDFLSAVERYQLYRFGFVLYPVHSFGVLQDEIAFLDGEGAAEVVFERNGIAITPQLNHEQAVSNFLDRVARRLGVRARLPHTTLSHHLRIPALKWVVDNPLMVIRVRSYSGGPYENQDAYTVKLALGTGLVMMASVLTDPREDAHSVSTSTARVNNFETLDIGHYLVFENAGRRKRLAIRRVPMNLTPHALAQLSDLAVDLDPSSWRPREVAAEIDRLSRAMEIFEKFHARHLIGGFSTCARRRVARKLFDSLFWFRRSFNSVADTREAVVSQAVAFETLLTDSYVATTAILEKVGEVLGSAQESDESLEIVRKLFVARGEAVHLGAAATRPNMRLARRTYVRCFMHVAERLHAVPRESSAPIAQVLAAAA